MCGAGRISLAYSNPYFDAGGIGGITAQAEVAERIDEYLRRSSASTADTSVVTNAFSGLTVAVQEGTSAQFYAEANLTGIRLVLCDSLPAAFESRTPHDLILKSRSSTYGTRHGPTSSGWQQASVLTHEQYAIVTDGDYRLRRFSMISCLAMSRAGSLICGSAGWKKIIYLAGPPRKVFRLPPKMPQHYDPGRCRWLTTGQDEREEASMKRVWFAAMMGILATLAIGVLTPSTGWAVDRAEAEETARLLAKLLKAGRLVVEQNQQLIDDQHKGDKGFTPEVFEQQLVQEFRQQTGIDLSKLQSTPASIAVPPLAKELLPAFVLASKEVVRDAQIVINQRGIG
jgi:type II secretory pathway pseudopilin PulG